MTRRSLRAALFACLALLPACTSPAEVGEPCTDSADCAGGLSCITIGNPEDGQYVCMSDCDLTMVRLCEGGEVCTDPLAVGRPDSLGICYLGGETPIGSSCSENWECVAGSQCILPSGICRRACSTESTSGCVAGETCRTLGGTAGFCEPDEP